MTTGQDTATGYDGSELTIGDRVQVRPDTPRAYTAFANGEIVGMVPTHDDRIRVIFPALPGRKFSGPADRFRKVEWR